MLHPREVPSPLSPSRQPIVTYHLCTSLQRDSTVLTIQVTGDVYGWSYVGGGGPTVRPCRRCRRPRRPRSRPISVRLTRPAWPCPGPVISISRVSRLSAPRRAEMNRARLRYISCRCSSQAAKPSHTTPPSRATPRRQAEPHHAAKPSHTKPPSRATPRRQAEPHKAAKPSHTKSPSRATPSRQAEPPQAAAEPHHGPQPHEATPPHRRRRSRTSSAAARLSQFTIMTG